MKQRMALGIGLLMLATIGGIANLSLSSGQPPASPPETAPIKPVAHAAPRLAAAHDTATMSDAYRRAFLAARSGAEWLVRVDNPINGRFQPGWVPALNIPVEQDRFLNQAGATYALARAAKFFGDERYLMKARQAVLSLLAETQTDPADANCRYTSLPPVVVNRLAAAGMLLLAIHSLHDPAEELLTQGEQLATFIRKQQHADGSFREGDAIADVEASGLAMHGLLLSARSRPASWKVDVVKKALPIFQKAWRAAPDPAAAARLAPAFAEAFVLSRDQAFGDAVLELGDFTCEMQYATENSNPKWVGGFREMENGKPALRAPGIASAGSVEALAAACLVSRHLSDAARYRRYREALGIGCQFLMSLQFTEANTMHFSPGYRPAMIGGFHASTQDGNLRLDYQERSLLALFHRLSSVGDR